jgi:hypothetical protein
VFVMTLTNDFAYSYDEARANRIKASRYFSDVDKKATGNFAYRVKPGYSHDGIAAMEYTYNGMKAFWGGKNAIEVDKVANEVGTECVYSRHKD